MGYEIIYHYQEKNGNQYDDNVKTFKKRIGDPYEDLPLEDLSRAILLQLARRDIYVKDLEIFEITKKKIKYKETKNGIILKNKKYLFGENLNLILESIEKDDEVAEEDCAEKFNKPTETETELTKEKSNINKTTSKPIKKMIYVPEPQQHIELLKKGVKLTPERLYDIYNIEQHPNGVNQIYTIIDDKNKTHKVSDLYFLISTNLSGDEEEKEVDTLNWSGLIKDSLPSLRKGI